MIKKSKYLNMLFKELMILLVELTKRSIYHNDIKPSNICYTFD
jgi:hypothetical protein